MTIRKKALIILGIALLSMIGTTYATSRYTFIRGLEEIEKQDTIEHITHTATTLSYLISNLETTTANWSARDDTYTFIKDGNEEYIQSNLTDESFVKLGLNLILFIDSSGDIIFSKAFDLDKEEEMPVPQGMLTHVSSDSLLLNQNTGHFTSGIILLNDGPILVASQPILTSTDEGPARGTLIFSHYLNDRTLDHLSQLTFSQISMQPLNKAIRTPFQQAVASLSVETPVFIQPLDNKYINGYVLLNDIYQKPVLILGITLPRDTYQLGQTAASYYIFSILGIGLIVGGTSLIIVQKEVLSRFTTLIKSITHITTSGDTSGRINLGGSDELSMVAGTINGMLATLEEASGEIQSSARRYQSIFETAGSAMAISGDDMVLKLVNTEFELLSGYSKEEVIDKKEWKEFISLNDWNKAKENYGKWVKNKQTTSQYFECHFTNRAGNVRDILLNIDKVSDTDMFVTSLNDITERKHATETLRRRYERERTLRRQLEEEIQKRVEYTRALVHELRTPITPVLAATELLLEEIKEEPLLRLVQSIDRSAKNLNQRIEELLDLARGETGMLQLDRIPMDPLLLLTNITSEMTPVAQSYKQTLTANLPSSLPKIIADSGRLQQVITNLLTNAFKFTPAGGKITLQAKESNGNLIVEVEDNGPGIDKEERTRIFEAYYRRVEDRERLSGLGLGLALSKNLVELHGGKIWVKSSKGKGSVFGFSIPINLGNQ
ncbi:CHASE4 domain-containing protein [Chloroflexota bacterium]